MEESGHYYTVYFTSLATGFDEDIAYKHALLAQMPDEVGYLDAANLHIKQCGGGWERDLNGNVVKPPSQWRYLIEYAVHSLPDRNTGNVDSGYHRRVTQQMLRRNKPDSLEFGLLLHRLGDTYAHSVMGDEKRLYTTTTSGATLACLNPYNLGHARHIIDSHGMHDPDYPFLRPELFYEYLEALYRVLADKIAEKDNFLFRSKRTALTKGQVKNIFYSLLGPRGLIGGGVRMGLSHDWLSKTFIYKIREQCERHIGVKMKKYQPELNEYLLSLDEFIKEHSKELDASAIN